MQKMYTDAERVLTVVGRAVTFMQSKVYLRKIEIVLQSHPVLLHIYCTLYWACRVLFGI